MIVLDTNVLSEYFRPGADPVVRRWVTRNIGQSALTSITIAEAYYSAFRLAEGKRRRDILEILDAAFMEASAAGRVFALEYDASVEFARLRAECEQRGRARSHQDLMIAAICRARGSEIATRNAKHFEGLGIEVIDPWAA